MTEKKTSKNVLREKLISFKCYLKNNGENQKARAKMLYTLKRHCLVTT